MDELETTKDVKRLASHLREIAGAQGCTCVIALSHPTAGWWVSVGTIAEQGSFEALGLAHQAVRSVEEIVDRCKTKAGTEAEPVRLKEKNT